MYLFFFKILAYLALLHFNKPYCFFTSIFIVLEFLINISYLLIKSILHFLTSNFFLLFPQCYPTILYIFGFNLE